MIRSFWEGETRLGPPNFGFQLPRNCFTEMQHPGGILFANRNKGQRGRYICDNLMDRFAYCVESCFKARQNDANVVQNLCNSLKRDIWRIY